MLLKNLKFGGRGLYNGMRGHITDFIADRCTVLFDDGQLVTITDEMFSG